jgi:hypothetical protein
MYRIYAVVFTILFLSACSTQRPIHNVSGSSVPIKSDGSMLTMEEVNKAINLAAKTKRWKPTNLDEDTVEVTITVRGRHTAVVDINFSQRDYDIILKRSEGLDQQTGKIHRNYNKWIILLDEQIQAELIEKATE